jgi:hypothetical protein
MTQVEFLRLYNSTSLCSYVETQARRRSRDPDNREDYSQAAWEAVLLMSSGCSTDTVKRKVVSAIFTEYMKDYRRRQREVPLYGENMSSICNLYK